ncbi:hypothetical protein KIN20_015340 [Parelaphostrongylus tenuis]|uniref:Uncharacterized protein n=1 Tax=Parelaphostrongylus tenuis TaxID=148309 RepID=A0AAD5N438_PARTN|nr:hypothetical protein KIN20_015340 [Parelaphostrongylus tenuis]
MFSAAKHGIEITEILSCRMSTKSVMIKQNKGEMKNVEPNLVVLHLLDDVYEVTMAQLLFNLSKHLQLISAYDYFSGLNSITLPLMFFVILQE